TGTLLQGENPLSKLGCQFVGNGDGEGVLGALPTGLVLYQYSAASRLAVIGVVESLIEPGRIAVGGHEHRPFSLVIGPAAGPRRITTEFTDVPAFGRVAAEDHGIRAVEPEVGAAVACCRGPVQFGHNAIDGSALDIDV